MFLLKSSCRVITAAIAVILVSACAAGPVPGSNRAIYRVTWTATRASDHVPLATASALVAPGHAATVRTHSHHPTEDNPAFTGFTGRLEATRTDGVVQLVSRASLLDANRNKKGKLKITKRNIGALLPMRAGETQPTNASGDPVELTVRLERTN